MFKEIGAAVAAEWARQGLRVGDLGVEPRVVEAIEAGSPGITTTQLERIAEIVRDELSEDPTRGSLFQRWLPTSRLEVIAITLGSPPRRCGTVCSSASLKEGAANARASPSRRRAATTYSPVWTGRHVARATRAIGAR